jgi:hypothetical protein
MSDRSPKFIAIDEESNHQIVHHRRFGKANRATYETLDPGAQIDVLVFDFLGVLFANCMLLWVDMPCICIPIGKNRVMPNGSNRVFSCRKTVFFRCPKTYANMVPLE